MQRGVGFVFRGMRFITNFICCLRGGAWIQVRGDLTSCKIVRVKTSVTKRTER